jgi:hypothetical protein
MVIGQIGIIKMNMRRNNEKAANNFRNNSGCIRDYWNDIDN